MTDLNSWGRYFHYQHTAQPLNSRFSTLSEHSESSPSQLPFGLGRSYGDSCLNEDGTLIPSNNLKHFIQFDTDSGILRAEAGVSLAEILQVIVARGWFLPVTPGTQFVTLGGAVANDVHGKNHNHVGTFGCHVTQFELLRSTGERLLCSAQKNIDYFQATIGGLGLTGFITWVEIQLIPIKNGFIEEHSFQCSNLDDMMQRFHESEQGYQYTVAWIDCLATGSQLGRGIFTRGNHCLNTTLPKLPPIKNELTVPFTFPPGCLNKLSVSAFNYLYYRKLGAAQKSSRQDYRSFFYPLDSLLEWNKLYGPKGFIQYQCVLVDDALDAMKALLNIIALSGQPSPLNVLKGFGAVKSPGLLSFPRKGLTLALDFPNRGKKTLQLCKELDVIVKQASGALYPAKDSRMPPDMFNLSFPQTSQFEQYIDPSFSSSFWRRVHP